MDTKPIRLGMIGGGQGAGIGKVHRFATQIDAQYTLTAGVLSSTHERSIQSGIVLGLDKDRCYPDYITMINKEKKRPDGVEAVVIVTPNYLHAEMIQACLNADIHVFCDKPMTATLAEAENLQSTIHTSDAHLVVTYNYSANALIHQARAMVANGDLGRIRIIQCEYPQDSLSRTETTNTKQAQWRKNPALSGAGTIADLGTHCFHLMSFVSGLNATGVYANLTSFGENHTTDDDAQALIDYETGAKGMVWASQVCDGGEHGLKIHISGTKGSLKWEQENSDKMLYLAQNRPTQILTRAGVGGQSAECLNISRVAPGHPEGYIEAFANIYTEMAYIIKAQRTGTKQSLPAHIPSYTDGLNGMKFVHACQQSSNNKKWVAIK